MKRENESSLFSPKWKDKSLNYRPSTIRTSRIGSRKYRRLKKPKLKKSTNKSTNFTYKIYKSNTSNAPNSGNRTMNEKIPKLRKYRTSLPQWTTNSLFIWSTKRILRTFWQKKSKKRQKFSRKSSRNTQTTVHKKYKNIWTSTTKLRKNTINKSKWKPLSSNNFCQSVTNRFGNFTTVSTINLSLTLKNSSK